MAKKSVKPKVADVSNTDKVDETSASFSFESTEREEVLQDFACAYRVYSPMDDCHNYYVDYDGDDIPDLEGKRLLINGRIRKCNDIFRDNENHLVIKVLQTR